MYLFVISSTTFIASALFMFLVSDIIIGATQYAKWAPVWLDKEKVLWNFIFSYNFEEIGSSEKNKNIKQAKKILYFKIFFCNKIIIKGITDK